MCLCVCVSWNVQPLPLNRKGVQLIASPPFPLKQDGGQTRRPLTVGQSDPRPEPLSQYDPVRRLISPRKHAVCKAPGTRHVHIPVNLSFARCLHYTSSVVAGVLLLGEGRVVSVSVGLSLGPLFIFHKDAALFTNTRCPVITSQTSPMGRRAKCPEKTQNEKVYKAGTPGTGTQSTITCTVQ